MGFLINDTSISWCVVDIALIMVGNPIPLSPKVLIFLPLYALLKVSPLSPSQHSRKRARERETKAETETLSFLFVHTRALLLRQFHAGPPVGRATLLPLLPRHEEGVASHNAVQTPFLLHCRCYNFGVTIFTPNSYCFALFLTGSDFASGTTWIVHRARACMYGIKWSSPNVPQQWLAVSS